MTLYHDIHSTLSTAASLLLAVLIIVIVIIIVIVVIIVIATAVCAQNLFPDLTVPTEMTPYDAVLVLCDAA